MLSAQKVQAEALIVTASDHQVDCISEIVLNLLQLPLPRKTKALVMKYGKLLKALGDLSTSVKKRFVLLQKHVKRIILLLSSVKKRLLSLLD